MNTCSRVPSGGTVTKILPRTRNDAMSKWGCSVASGREGATRRASARSLMPPRLGRWAALQDGGSTQDRGHALAATVGEKLPILVDGVMGPPPSSFYRRVT